LKILTPRNTDELLKEITERGFADLIRSDEKTLADRLVREGKLELSAVLPNGGKRYKLAPSPKEKKSITCKGCGVKFKAWTAGMCGKCKK
jgi:hypothetical protein